MTSEFYIDPNTTFTATVKSVEFAVQDSTNTYLLPYTSYAEFKGSSS
mgnify:CR=1 FL=1